MEKRAFLELCQRKGYSPKDIGRFEKAIDFAREAFHGRQRLSGEDYILHNLRVASTLAENHSEPDIVVTGILHSLIDQKEQVTASFGADIWALVREVEEIKEIKNRNRNLQAAAIKKVLMTTLKDTRVILIKLANRLDNLHSIDIWPREKQQQIAEETIEIYAPLAYRLGSDKLKTQLEDLAFKILNPKKYEEINNFLRDSREQREKDIAHVIELVKRAAEGHVHIVKIKGRPKHIYSIYRKMTFRATKLQDQHDLLGIRAIVADEKDCYTFLGILHENFEPVEGRLKDYIANPKPNFYRSIHTCVRVLGKTVEVQIRTPEMDELAEEGIAAHWKYKGVKSDEFFEKKMGWLRGIIDLQKDQDSREFIETAKVDVFGDMIYCYTPKGQLKELPRSATVLDFAFTVHEEIGKHAVAGRVNGRFVPLRHELLKGDVVEVLTNKNQTPHRSWLKYVRSAGARHKIRRFLNQTSKTPAPHYRLPKAIAGDEKAVLVESLDYPAALCSLAKCCNPLPGEGIVGITTKRRIISVHKDSCKAALKEAPRWVKVSWKHSFSNKIRFLVAARERSGLLADLLHTIANAHFEVKEAKAKLVGPEEMECAFLVIPRDLEHVQELVKRLGKIKSVNRLYFGD